MSFNKITVCGHLGRDPELRYTPAGLAVCSFSMATSDKRQGEEITTWFKITLWGKQAEAAAKYLTKGSPVYIEGRLRIEEWTDRENNNRFTLEVNASDMQFIGSGNGNGNSRQDEAEVETEDADEAEAPEPPKAKAAKAGKGTKKAAPANDDIPF